MWCGPGCRASSTGWVMRSNKPPRDPKPIRLPRKSVRRERSLRNRHDKKISLEKFLWNVVGMIGPPRFNLRNFGSRLRLRAVADCRVESYWKSKFVARSSMRAVSMRVPTSAADSPLSSASRPPGFTLLAGESRWPQGVGRDAPAPEKTRDPQRRPCARPGSMEPVPSARP